MTEPACVGKKVLVSGATPFDPQNEIAPFQVAACETTNQEYSTYEERLPYTRFELLVTYLSGGTSVVASFDHKDALNRRAAQEAGRDDVAKTEKRTVSSSERPALDATLAGPDQPVANVSAREALRYCQAQGGRLPTNQEWEKMARGPQGFDYGTNDGTLKCGRNAQCDTNVSAVVGSFAAGGFGTYDTVGNVWEWTMESSGEGSIRGGSWSNFHFSDFLRADFRDDIVPDFRGLHVGFRCVWPQDSKK